MEGGEENREKLNLSMRMSGFSSDLLNRFMIRRSNPDEQEDEEAMEEEMELSLGLSINGRFGVDPMRKKRKRSSSISNLVFTVGAADNGGTRGARGVEFDRHAPLSRTRSLLTEAVEEWRRCKEFQSMRRMEARKRRIEKLKNVRVMKDNDICFDDFNDVTGFAEVTNGGIDGQRIDNGVLLMSENGNEISSSQGSVGSQRSGSSGISDIECRQKEAGSPQNGEAPPSQEAVEEELARAGSRDVKLANHALKNAVLDMPYVSTKVDGPNVLRIEGFLYKYEKG